MLRAQEIKKKIPYAVIIIILINIGVHAIVFSSPEPQSILESYGVKSARILAGQGLHTLLTSMFLHAGYFHLFSNLLTLLIFGYILENGIGSKRFLILYFLAGLTASLFHIGAASEATIPAIGASGSIAGITGACLVGFPTERAPLAFLIFLVFPIFLSFIPPLVAVALFFMVLVPAILLTVVKTVPIFPFLLIWIIYQVYRGAAEIGAATGVAYWAHIGGFIGGLILYIIFRVAEPSEEEQEWEEIPATSPKF